MIHHRAGYRLWSLFLLCAALTGCSSSPQEPQRYMLSVPVADTATADMPATTRIVIGHVDIASFIDGRGLVIETSANQLHEARQHVWAEPLRAQLERQLRQGLSQQLPHVQWLPQAGSANLRSLDYRLDLRVDAFHLTYTGDVWVAGQWQLRDYEQNFHASGYFSQSRGLGNDGYPAVVEALDAAWHDTLRKLAEAIQDAILSS